MDASSFCKDLGQIEGILPRIVVPSVPKKSGLTVI